MRKLGLKILGILVVAIMMLEGTVTMAANINELNNEKEENQDKINEKKQEKQEITEQKNKTVEEVEKLDSQITDYESQIKELNTKIEDLNNNIKQSEEKLIKAQEDYTKQEDLLEARLIAIQEAGETSYLDFLLSSDSITDLISNYYLVTEITTNDTQLLEKIQKQKKEIETAKEELESSKRELDTSKASKQSVSTQLKTAKEEKNKQVVQLSQDEQKIQQQIDEIAQANRDIDSKIALAIKQAQKNSNKNSSNSANSSGSGSTAASGSSGFIYPVPSGYTRITTGLYYSSGQYHGAVDFGSAGINGQPVYAVADGEVIVSERLSGSYGNYIIIMHNNGLFTLYAHGQDGSRTVSVGQSVKQGQQIMRVGTTGNSTGPHLHFEVRVSPGLYANRRNPLNYL